VIQAASSLALNDNKILEHCMMYVVQIRSKLRLWIQQVLILRCLVSQPIVINHRVRTQITFRKKPNSKSF